MAAHLHDSVLQTLALIQTNAQDPARVVRLARAQERDLRGWLYGAAAEGAEGVEGFAAALRAGAAAAEEAHGVPVEVVTVGDAPVTPGSDGAGRRRAGGDGQRRAPLRRRPGRRVRRGGRRHDRGVRARPGARLRPRADPGRPAGRARQHHRPDEPSRRPGPGAQRARARAPRCTCSCATARRARARSRRSRRRADEDRRAGRRPRAVPHRGAQRDRRPRLGSSGRRPTRTARSR